VDAYDVCGLGLSQLRPWLSGPVGSVVTLSFDGANTRYDTSIVRASGPAPLHSPTSDDMKRDSSRTHDFDSWRQSSLYNAADSDDGRDSRVYQEDEGYYDGAIKKFDSYAGAPSQFSPPDPHYSDGGWRAGGSPGGSGAAGRAPQSSSWAEEADKILAEAQAKIEDALHRERLLQETLDMLREKNAVSFSALFAHEGLDGAIFGCGS